MAGMPTNQRDQIMLFVGIIGILASIAIPSFLSMRQRAKAAEAVKKAVELEARMKELAAQETAEAARKNALLEEEKNKSLELAKTAEQLREALNLVVLEQGQAEKIRLTGGRLFVLTLPPAGVAAGTTTLELAYGN